LHASRAIVEALEHVGVERVVGYRERVDRGDGAHSLKDLLRLPRRFFKAYRTNLDAYMRRRAPAVPPVSLLCVLLDRSRPSADESATGQRPLLLLEEEFGQQQQQQQQQPQQQQQHLQAGVEPGTISFDHVRVLGWVLCCIQHFQQIPYRQKVCALRSLACRFLACRPSSRSEASCR
jgi:hypothetical protein